jgi:dTDP-4-amino-4,6-dideoxygalactose transaminase
MVNRILFNDLGKQWEVIKDDALPRIDNLFNSSSYINGPDVNTFENNFAQYIGTDYAVGVSNGTDALKLCVEALNLEGKVGIIVPANTFIATLLGAEMALPNAEFILTDCDEYYQMDMNTLEDILSKRRGDWDECVIMPVHLYGSACDIEKIMKLSRMFNCWVIEDCSQAHGTTTNKGRPVGTFGHMSAFSMYPGKNLGAAGDAGVITTNNKHFYDTLKLLQNWGAVEKYYYERKGYNNRLDSIQAIIVDEKLKHLNEWNENREKIASWYDELIQNDKIIKPKKASYCGRHTYHIYCVRLLDLNRDEVMSKLNDNDIQSGIHYPIPIEQTKIYEDKGWNNTNTRLYAEQLMSLPMHPFMTREDVERIAKVINNV